MLQDLVGVARARGMTLSELVREILRKGVLKEQMRLERVRVRKEDSILS